MSKEVSGKLLNYRRVEKNLGKSACVTVVDPMYIEMNSKNGLNISLVDFCLKDDVALHASIDLHSQEFSEEYSGMDFQFVVNTASLAILPKEHADSVRFHINGIQYNRVLDVEQGGIIGVDSAEYLVEIIDGDNQVGFHNFHTGADGFVGEYYLVYKEGKVIGLLVQLDLDEDMMDFETFVKVWENILNV